MIDDASLRHQGDDSEQPEALIDRQQVRQVLAGTDADDFILACAGERDAQIVSDRFHEYRDRFQRLEARRVPSMIVDGHVQRYEDKLEEARTEQEPARKRQA